jgi:predicted DCC family thiol-disulfide oxidoreductase YuxK
MMTPSIPIPDPLVLYDGECNLCRNSIEFIEANDPRNLFSLVPAQSRLGRRLLSELQLPDGPPETVLLYTNGETYERSDAALRIARFLIPPWPLLFWLLLLPGGLRDAVYRVIARNRYRWFGRCDRCRLPR